MTKPAQNDTQAESPRTRSDEVNATLPGSVVKNGVRGLKKLKDESGNRYGDIVVVGCAGLRIYGNGASHAYWHCRCKSGHISVIRGAELRNGQKRCPVCRGHGHTIGERSPTYYTWSAMWNRCYKPSQKSFKYYGGRGIQICLRWHRSNPNGFNNFLADMGERPRGKTLDRINGEWGYMSSNCRWATDAEQWANKKEAA